jgi:magnesium-transporting ATPase (P-type)
MRRDAGKKLRVLRIAFQTALLSASLLPKNTPETNRINPEVIMLHVWLVPAMLLLSGAVWVFYLAMKFTGGSGVRTEGRTMVDKPVEEENPPL